MARVFRRSYRNRHTGKLKPAAKWYLEFVDQKHDLTRRLPGYTDKKSTAALGENLERLSARAAARQEPDAGMRRWLEGLPAELQERLLSWGLIDGKRAAAAKPLRQYVEEYQSDLLARGVKPKHAHQTATRVRKVAKVAGFTYWTDLSASRTQTAIDRICASGRPLKIQT